MEFGKIKFRDWVFCNPHDWGRYESEFFSIASIHLMKSYNDSDYGTWYPYFCGKIDFLQKIYAEITYSKKFQWNEEELAKKYVDQFLIRMNKLRIFT